jgi:hypothetical protein
MDTPPDTFFRPTRVHKPKAVRGHSSGEFQGIYGPVGIRYAAQRLVGGRPQLIGGLDMADDDLVRARRAEIRRVAQAHGVETIRWWPPQKADFLIGELPESLRELRADLQRVLGCKVSIYLSEHQPEEVRRRLAEQTVDLEEGGEP